MRACHLHDEHSTETADDLIDLDLDLLHLQPDGHLPVRPECEAKYGQSSGALLHNLLRALWSLEVLDCYYWGSNEEDGGGGALPLHCGHIRHQPGPWGGGHVSHDFGTLSR